VQASRDKTIPAYWFNGFAKEESTFDVDGIGDHAPVPHVVPSGLVRSGPSLTKASRAPIDDVGHDGILAEWFEESPSGGPHEAWRTRFPALETFHHEAMDALPLLPDHVSRRLQDYIPTAATSIARVYAFRDTKNAPWFQASVSDYDSFGRGMPASQDSDRWYLDWTQKSWSAPIACEKAGCMANATLKTFDSTQFQHARCKLSFRVYATDFDDEYSRENVEWLLVNDRRVMKLCDPMAKGCCQDRNVTKRGMHSCLLDYPLDNFLERGTTLKFASKISEMVDECPVDNKLLNGEVGVTCFLKPWPPPRQAPKPMFASELLCESTTAALRCHEKGCNSSAVVRPCSTPKQDQKCLLNVKIWQTDFDQDHGSVEVVEWVKLNGKEAAKDLKPGKNPCKEACEGKSSGTALLAAGSENEPNSSRVVQKKDASPPAERTESDADQTRSGFPDKANSFMETLDESTEYPPGSFFRKFTHWRGYNDVMEHIVKDQDVTKEVLAEGAVLVEAKISKMVDECAKDGYLLNAEVTLHCK
jgi:hypothetical protein